MLGPSLWRLVMMLMMTVVVTVVSPAWSRSLTECRSVWLSFGLGVRVWGFAFALAPSVTCASRAIMKSRIPR